MESDLPHALCAAPQHIMRLYHHVRIQKGACMQRMHGGANDLIIRNNGEKFKLDALTCIRNL